MIAERLSSRRHVTMCSASEQVAHAWSWDVG
ncbi:MAG: hypothetical protein QOF51_2031 [Chloroflexota bacterium]|nr:hypothetical protein [Chloroflexota bacterium]